MSTLSQILALLTATLFGYIMYLETFATTSPPTTRVFKITLQRVMRNQGIYNGCTALMLVYAILFASQPKEFAAVLLLNCITVTACGAPPNKSILFKQGGLPILALISLWF
ncbi:MULTISPECIES: DUF1304 domain-containing protein [unclassified Eikenella]|uniref:DUF1304 domain-containing protein n=2 Tax=Neisseriaceae TaxID=481 RepID=UPI0007DF4710|nr:MULTISPECIES: DUF1304 family protein [unclassified Eikenella]OAM39760.1 hypothetical protein A7P99_00610 [Eikenella sp. NML120348]OAM45841.1 hypothetical protein A7Q03_00615 [Eikenella sp. NML99-0057]